MANVEEFLISSVINLSSILEIMDAEVEAKHFAIYPNEFKWIVDYATTNKRVPEREVFETRFPEFIIHKTKDVDFYITEIKKQYLSRTITKQIESAISHLQADEPEKALNTLAQQLSRTQKLVTTCDAVEIGTNWEWSVKELERRIELVEQGGFTGIPTGFNSLDELTSGLQGGDLAIIAARLGAGKSWTMIKMATEAIKYGKNVCFHTLEMPKHQMAFRFHPFLNKAFALGYTITVNGLFKGTGSPSAIEYAEFLKYLEYEMTSELWIKDSSKGSISISSIASQQER